MTAVSTGPSLQTLTAGDFRPHLGTMFRMTGAPYGGEPAAIDAELAEVTEHPADPSGRYRSPFSVLFCGPLQPVLLQGIYRLEHEHLGELDLFIVPVGPGELGAAGQPQTAMRYEAVFN
jgi:uncharacterized protein DUF6916